MTVVNVPSSNRPALPHASRTGTLASRDGTWQCRDMASRPPRKTPLAGGFIIALGAIGGAVYGGFHHQATIGLLAGVGIAVVISVLLWLFSRG